MSYRMTERRFQQVEAILEKYRAAWVTAGSCDVSRLENELKVQLKTGYKEIQSKPMRFTSHLTPCSNCNNSQPVFGPVRRVPAALRNFSTSASFTNGRPQAV